MCSLLGCGLGRSSERSLWPRLPGASRLPLPRSRWVLRGRSHRGLLFLPGLFPSALPGPSICFQEALQARNALGEASLCC